MSEVHNAGPGTMCNYRYELKDIEKNHAAYVNEGAAAASRHVHALLKAKPDRARRETGGRCLALSGLRTAKFSAHQDG